MNETVLQISWRSVALACLLAACSAEEGTDVPGTDAMRLYSALDIGHIWLERALSGK